MHSHKFRLKNLCGETQTGTLLKKPMWGDSNWKIKDLVNSTFNYIKPRIPWKSRYVRANQVPFMNKTINKAIMVRNTQQCLIVLIGKWKKN